MALVGDIGHAAFGRYIETESTDWESQYVRYMILSDATKYLEDAASRVVMSTGMIRLQNAFAKAISERKKKLYIYELPCQALCSRYDCYLYGL